MNIHISQTHQNTVQSSTKREFQGQKGGILLMNNALQV